MAHFSEIGLNNTVLRIVAVHNNELLDDNGVEQESLGAEFCRNLFGGTWVQTSYNGNIRQNFAAVGYIYDSDLDIFVPPATIENDSNDTVVVVPNDNDSNDTVVVVLNDNDSNEEI